jgi:hypothetical protein
MTRLAGVHGDAQPQEHFELLGGDASNGDVHARRIARSLQRHGAVRPERVELDRASGAPPWRAVEWVL